MAPAARDDSRWVRRVMRASHALDLEPGVFTWTDPAAIARSLMRSARASTRRKSTPFRSAMSMLVFHLNRCGRRMPPERRACLEAAKDELRRIAGHRMP